MAIASAISFTTKFDFKPTIAKFNLTDTTDYTAEGISLSDLKGNFKIVNPLGVVVYENTSWITPDIDGSVSLDFNTVSIPSTVQGYWEFTYTIQVSGAVQAGEYSKSVQYNYQYVAPQVSIYQEGNPYTELFKSSDQTIYTVNGVIPTVSRTHTVIYPILLGLPNFVTTASYAGIGYPKFGVGVWQTDISTTLDYTFNDGLLVSDIVEGSKQLDVKDAPNIVDVLCCLNNLNEQIKLADSTSQQEPLIEKFDYASSLLNTAVQSINYGQYSKAEDYINQIYELTGCTPNCNCGGSLVRSVQYNGESNSAAYEGIAPIDVSGSTISLDFNGIENNYLRQSGPTSVIGRSSNSTGNVADITASANNRFLVRRSNILVFGDLLDTDVITALGFTPYDDTNPDGFISGNQTITISGQASGSGATSISLTLDNAAVIGKVLTGFTSAVGVISASDTLLSAIEKLNGNLAALSSGSVTNSLDGLSVLGRNTNSTGTMAAVTAGSNYQVLRRNGTTIGFGSIDLSQSATVASSILGVVNGGTARGSATTLGSIWFAAASGVLEEDNANLFYDKTNVRLGLGTSTPTERVHAKSKDISDVDVSYLLETTTTGSSNSGYQWKNGNSVNARFGGFGATYGYGTSTAHEFNEYTNSLIRRKTYSSGEMYFSPDNTTAPAGPTYDYHFRKSSALSMVLQSTSGNPYYGLIGSTSLFLKTLVSNGYLQSSNLLNFSPNGLDPSSGQYAGRFETNNVFSLKYGLAIDGVTYYNTSSGSAVTIANDSYGVIIGPSTSGTVTVTLPSSPADGQEVCVLVEANKTITLSSAKTIYGHNGGLGIAMNLTNDASAIMAKYFPLGNGGVGAWYLTGL